VLSPPSETVKVSNLHDTPVPSAFNKNAQTDANAYWHIIDYYSGANPPTSTYCGYVYPVSNTVQGINSGGTLMYEPINVAYGTNNAFTWAQFVIYFDSSQDLPTWGLQIFYEPGGQWFTPSIGASYNPGDTYWFVIQPSGDTTVQFYIEDLNNTNNYWSTPISVPQPTTIVNPTIGGSQYYSPASCVEGLMDTTQLTNVPYFQTYLIIAGYSSHSRGGDGTPPQGIQSAVWTVSGASAVYESMLSETDISSIVNSQTCGIGYGSVSNPTNLIGTQNGNYAGIYGGNPGDGGEIVGQMNTLSGGNIYVYGYSTSGYYSNLYVYVSMDDNTWYQIGSYTTVSSTTPYWINAGSYMGDFKYIAVVGYDSYDSVNLHLDAVKVGT
jgi:hypothetical protein